MKRIQLWVDESEFKKGRERFFAFGGLALEENAFGDFCKKLYEAREELNEFSSLHANEFDSSSGSKWRLLKKWVSILKEEDKAIFISFVFKKKKKGECLYHDYMEYEANQLAQLFVMKLGNHEYLNFFRDIESIKMIYDRKNYAKGSFLENEDVGSLIVINDLEKTYTIRVKRRINLNLSNRRLAQRVDFKFTFCDDECFDVMQFSDCLTYMLMQNVKFYFNEEYKLDWVKLRKSINNEKLFYSTQDTKFNFYPDGRVEDIMRRKFTNS